ncbi:MAG: MoxR family ATPase, partial [Paracoccaceae bacterium]
MTKQFATIDDTQSGVGAQGYICGRALATVVFLALKLGGPVFL